MFVSLLAGLAALPVAGAATLPSDVSVTALATYNNEPVLDFNATSAAYVQVVRQLGAAIITPTAAPAETLGLSGFDAQLGSSVAFIDARGTDADPAPWERLHPQNDPVPVLWIPRLGVRKGLPASVDLGGDLGYVGGSRQMVFGGWVRYAPIEGYRQFPDVVLQLGYNGYIGNDELELGVLDWTGGLGYTLPFGQLVGINTASFAPWAALSLGIIHCDPNPDLDETTATNLGITPLSGFRGSDDFTNDLRVVQGKAGFRIVSGGFTFNLAGTYAFGLLAGVDLALGLVY